MLWRRKRHRIDDRTAMVEELRHGQRHEPNHVFPPNGLNAISDLFANEIDRAIFDQLGNFAEVANHYLDWSRWTIEQMAETALGDSHPSYGRRLRLYFNRIEVGGIDLQPVFGARIEKTVRAQCSATVNEAQHIPHEEMQGLLTSLVHLLADDHPDAFAKGRQNAMEAMSRFMWGVMVDPDDPPPLEFQAEGSFGFYFVRERVWREAARP